MLSASVDRLKRSREHSHEQEDSGSHMEGQGTGLGQGHGQGQGHTDIDISNESRNSIFNASDNLLLLLSYEEGLTNILHTKGGLESVLLSLLSNNKTDFPPLSITSSKAKEVCLLFLSENVFNIVSMAPVGSANLIDKLFELHFSMPMISNTEVKVLENGEERDKDMMKLISKVDALIISEVTWSELIVFCSVCSVWAVRHSLIAASLMAQYSISLSELRAVRSNFTTFDRQLDGHINAFDLRALLEVNVMITLDDYHCDYYIKYIR